jgi:phosphopantothenoylcysteine decarboxylase/phosphopantothenate--cysteine ligase
MNQISLLQNKRIVLGVTGSIACYKAIDLASKLTQAGAKVDVILTEAATQFVTPLAFQSVTGRPTYTDLWTTERSGGLPTHIAHIGLAESADMIAIIPCTAHHIGKLAQGLADDLISITVLAARCPVLIAPAGDGNMLDHPAVRENLTTLTRRGVLVIDPEPGRNASGLYGKGRLPETPTLLGEIRATFGRVNGILKGKRVVVTAGGTREPLDPVRFLTNKSTGKQGYAVAQAAIDAGAKVILISTLADSTVLPTPIGATVITVESAAQMLEVVLAQSATADALVMAAAVADYRPETYSDQKIKKHDSALGLSLARTTDILYTVGQRRRETGFPRVLVGFAAETEDLLENAQGKLERKNADLIVANDVSLQGAGFAEDTNIVTLLHRGGARESLSKQSKALVAEAIILRVAAALDERG